MNSEHEAEDKLIREIVDRCAGQIREHVDCVQILVNTHREDGSAMIERRFYLRSVPATRIDQIKSYFFMIWRAIHYRPSGTKIMTVEAEPGTPEYETATHLISTAWRK